MSDLDDLEEIADQNDFHGAREDARGSKRGKVSRSLVLWEKMPLPVLLSRRRRKVKITLAGEKP